MGSSINYDINSHIFKTYMKNGVYNPLSEMVIYDGGTVSEEYEIEYDGGNVTDEEEE